MTFWNQFSPSPWESGGGFAELYDALGTKSSKKKTVNLICLNDMGKLASRIKIVFESLITLLSTLEDTHLILLKLVNLPDVNTVHLYKMQAYVSEGFSKIGEKIIWIVYSDFEASEAGQLSENIMDGGSVPIIDTMHEESFLNNRMINCCFITTYAGVLSSVFKKGAKWFTFVTPTIGTPINSETPELLESSETSSEFDSISLDTQDVTCSVDSLVNDRPVGRIRTRLTQKQRREMARLAKERTMSHNQKTDNFFKFVCFFFGAKGELEAVKYEEFQKPLSSPKEWKKRSGYNRRKNSLKVSQLPPKQKEPIIVDEDGFQVVTKKKAARLRPQTEPVVVSEPEVDKIKKKAKKNNKKKNKPVKPSAATIIHDMKSYYSITDPMVEMEDEEYEDTLCSETPEPTYQGSDVEVLEVHQLPDNLKMYSVKDQAQEYKIREGEDGYAAIIYYISQFLLIMFFMIFVPFSNAVNYLWQDCNSPQPLENCQHLDEVKYFEKLFLTSPNANNS
ncbi:hypothetical protein L5515_016077 [Caenorhabditis briggsae]|uniref:Uncharacterized protein n=1 Tax=Caenorhabditis briggsae TaxID=6238 RepID=A0AAE9FBI2_CAEBR|nr:hypothetical protein L5515_016077 [Caenorhabditis briggsae]